MARLGQGGGRDARNVHCIDQGDEAVAGSGIDGPELCNARKQEALGEVLHEARGAQDRPLHTGFPHTGLDLPAVARGGLAGELHAHGRGEDHAPYVRRRRTREQRPDKRCGVGFHRGRHDEHRLDAFNRAVVRIGAIPVEPGLARIGRPACCADIVRLRGKHRDQPSTNHAGRAKYQDRSAHALISVAQG